ncbi:MAG TPA: cation diffusion facilitator family transporter [Victivallales bacterium]|nr:cation diffusion facilitator family transporter [Victivallales bacterium]
MSRTPYIPIQPQNVKVIKVITWWGMIINIFLALLKFILGYIGNSQAVIADGVHSLSDTITDIAIILGVKFWAAPPDTKHPYGHLKIETIVTAFISIVLVIVSVGIAYEAIVTIKEHKSHSDLWIAVIGPLISIIIKEALYRWNINTGKRIKSSSLIANAWHHRSDAISSLMAVAAVSISLISPNFAFVDNIGAVIVSLFIIKVAWDILSPAISELSDKGASEKIQSKIRKISLEVNNVKSVHAIRTREIGSCIYVDLHVLVDGKLSVEKGHYISDTVQKALIENIPEIIDVIVHIEPYGTIHNNII